jgi:hypothetical protein
MSRRSSEPRHPANHTQLPPAGLSRRAAGQPDHQVQIGFHRPVPAGDSGSHRLKAANLAAVWRAFQASGAGCLIAVGPLDQPEVAAAYIAALPVAPDYAVPAARQPGGGG